MTLQKLCSLTRKGLDDFQMLREGECVAVGVSGGKDSLALLAALAAISKYHPKHFTVKAITVNLGFDGADFSAVRDYAKGLGVEYHVAKTKIGKVVFEARKEKNPCSLCSKMKRSVLCETAKKLGCTSLALAHHKDDLIDTFLLNLYYSGSLSTFLPVTELDKTGIRVIRPLLYVEEKDVVYFAGKNPMPVTPSLCPADKNTAREKVKRELNEKRREIPDIKAKIFGAILRGGLLDPNRNGNCE